MIVWMHILTKLSAVNHRRRIWSINSLHTQTQIVNNSFKLRFIFTKRIGCVDLFSKIFPINSQWSLNVIFSWMDSLSVNVGFLSRTNGMPQQLFCFYCFPFERNIYFFLYALHWPKRENRFFSNDKLMNTIDQVK